MKSSMAARRAAVKATSCACLRLSMQWRYLAARFISFVDSLMTLNPIISTVRAGCWSCSRVSSTRGGSGSTSSKAIFDSTTATSQNQQSICGTASTKRICISTMVSKYTSCLSMSLRTFWRRFTDSFGRGFVFQPILTRAGLRFPAYWVVPIPATSAITGCDGALCALPSPSKSIRLATRRAEC